MLPYIRNDEYLFEIPKFDISGEDVHEFINEFKGFHDIFSDCFHRSESRDHFFRYMVGQFSQIERKSIEPIALSIEDGNVRAMQRFISEAEWDDNKIQTKYHSLVFDDMGSPNGVLIFDETGFVKKGNDSIGVARQYCGSIGKVENSQVGVFAAYASPHGYALLDKRLFIPEKWFDKEHELRRIKCKLSNDIEFKTKPQLAADMLNSIHKEGIIPFKYVVADCLYGNSDDFLETVESYADLTYFVAIPSETKCLTRQPVMKKKKYKYGGKVRIKQELDDDEKRPVTVSYLAENLNDFFWYRRTVSEGTKGPIEYEFTKRHVVISNNNLPHKKVWLIMRRTIGDNPTYKFYISNASASVKLNLFVWLSGIRWAVEQCFEETKSELGMDHYEVRKYPGWHHHILTCMLAHFFLWHIKIRLGEKSTVYYTVSA